MVVELRRLLATPAVRRVRMGVAVLDLLAGEMLFEHEADELFSVASNNKLFTTAAALELLGPSFQFRTTVLAVGRLRRDGVLEGDLAVVGRGDPCLSARFHEGNPTAALEQWVQAVAQAGIRSVRGGVIADDTYFDRQHLHPEWPRGQELAWYCAPISALSFNENCIQVIVRSGAAGGAPALVSLAPPTHFAEVLNSCVTSRVRHRDNRVAVHRRLGGNVVTVGGEINPGGPPFQGSITIEEPALYTATVFRELLAAKDIPTGSAARLRIPGDRFEPAGCREIATTRSPLRDAVAVANTNSHNLYAEHILKTLGRERAGQGTFAAGAQAVADFLRQAGVRGTFHNCDGSGLAAANRFTPHQVVSLLAYMNSRRTGGVYLRSLAEPGRAGTLARRLAPLLGRLFAKTGYIANVSCLSGYIEARNGRLLAFSILANNLGGALGDVRALQDAVCLCLSQYEP